MRFLAMKCFESTPTVALCIVRRFRPYLSLSAAVAFQAMIVRWCVAPFNVTWALPFEM